MYGKAEHAALGCPISSPCRRAAEDDVKRELEEGYVLMTKMNNISNAELLIPENDDGAYMDRKRVTKGASHLGQEVHLRL